jgi:hypothetical protein
MTAQHTPGPWTHTYKATVHEKSTGSSIAQVHNFYDAKGHSQTGANTLLISAAPDLLAALESLLEWCILKEKESPYVANTRKPIVIEQVKQAIRKAKG